MLLWAKTTLRAFHYQTFYDEYANGFTMQYDSIEMTFCERVMANNSWKFEYNAYVIACVHHA